MNASVTLLLIASALFAAAWQSDRDGRDAQPESAILNGIVARTEWSRHAPPVAERPEALPVAAIPAALRPSQAAFEPVRSSPAPAIEAAWGPAAAEVSLCDHAPLVAGDEDLAGPAASAEFGGSWPTTATCNWGEPSGETENPPAGWRAEWLHTEVAGEPAPADPAPPGAGARAARLWRSAGKAADSAARSAWHGTGRAMKNTGRAVEKLTDRLRSSFADDGTETR